MSEVPLYPQKPCLQLYSQRLSALMCRPFVCLHHFTLTLLSLYSPHEPRQVPRSWGSASQPGCAATLCVYITLQGYLTYENAHP